MARRREGWSQLAGRLGGAALELVSAEARGLRAELTRSGRTVAVLGAIGGLAFGFLFWALGLFLVGAVSALALVWPLWLAALTLALLLVLVAAALAVWIRSRLRRLESPAASVRRRFDDHLEWWQNEVMSDVGGIESRGARQTRKGDRASSSRGQFDEAETDLELETMPVKTGPEKTEDEP